MKFSQGRHVIQLKNWH